MKQITLEDVFRYLLKVGYNYGHSCGTAYDDDFGKNFNLTSLRKPESDVIAAYLASRSAPVPQGWRVEFSADNLSGRITNPQGRSVTITAAPTDVVASHPTDETLTLAENRYDTPSAEYKRGFMARHTAELVSDYPDDTELLSEAYNTLEKSGIDLSSEEKEHTLAKLKERLNK
jgi:hypothetical protein